jgi:hypothetical protein
MENGRRAKLRDTLQVGPTPTPSYMSTPTTGGREGRASVKVIAELVDFVACVFKERLTGVDTCPTLNHNKPAGQPVRTQAAELTQ